MGKGELKEEEQKRDEPVFDVPRKEPPKEEQTEADVAEESKHETDVPEDEEAEIEALKASIRKSLEENARAGTLCSIIGAQMANPPKAYPTVQEPEAEVPKEESQRGQLA